MPWLCADVHSIIYVYMLLCIGKFFTAVTPDISRDTRVYLKVHVSYYLIYDLINMGFWETFEIMR